MTVASSPPLLSTAPEQPKARQIQNLRITWEKLPEDYILDDDPVDNIAQPLLAAALRESLELAGYLQPQTLVATNFGLCATLNDELVIKAPDWVYVPTINAPEDLFQRRSYTPNLEGDPPLIVMEFLSYKEGTEYSAKRTNPIGKWFFYEQILQVPYYVIFESEGGLLEFHRLTSDIYQLEQPDPDGRHWIAEINLFLGAWRGQKADMFGYWLRWWDAEGNLLPWGMERVEAESQRAEAANQRAEAESQRAEAESQRAEAESQRAERLAKYLRSQGIDPNTIEL